MKAASPLLPLNILIVVLVSACATKPPVRFSTYESGQWQSRTSIRDTQKKKTFVTDLEIAAKSSGDLRIDVVSSLGMHLATLAMTKSDAAYILTREKRFFQTKTPSLAFEKVLGAEIDPQILFIALFESIDAKSEWVCERDAKGQLSLCKNKHESGSTIAWFERENARRKVKINVARYEVNLDLRSFRPNVQLDPQLFRLTKPAGFHEIP